MSKTERLDTIEPAISKEVINEQKNKQKTYNLRIDPLYIQ